MTPLAPVMPMFMLLQYPEKPVWERPHPKSKAQSSINEALVSELVAGGRYLERRENGLLVGNPKTGKTQLATALGFVACAQGKRVRFSTTTAMLDRLTHREHIVEANSESFRLRSAKKRTEKRSPRSRPQRSRCQN